MLSQNGLRLGHGAEPYREAKRAGFKSIFRDYDVVALQEVMDPAEPARLAPEGFTVTVSTAKGRSSYREHYAVLSRDASVRVLATAEFPDAGGVFARAPFGVAVEDKDRGRYWLVDIHVVYGKGGVTPRRDEVAAMAEVTEWYAGQTLPDGARAERVVVAGDWNLPATDPAFAALAEAVPGLRAGPNVRSTLNAKGEFASAYDHFLWDRARMNVDFADDPRETGGLDPLTYRETLSDHMGVAGYVLANPTGTRPDGVGCPPPRGRGPTS